MAETSGTRQRQGGGGFQLNQLNGTPADGRVVSHHLGQRADKGCNGTTSVRDSPTLT